MVDAGCTGMCGVDDSFSASNMAKKLYSYRGVVCNWVKTRYPMVYTEALALEAHSAGLFKVLEGGYTGMSDAELTKAMFDGAYQTVKIELDERQTCKAFLTPDKPVRRYIDFNKLDPRYVDSMPTVKKAIWKLRCQGLSVKEIANKLNRSINLILSHMYQLRKGYKHWLEEVSWYDDTLVQYLPNLRYVRTIMRLRYQRGYPVAHIAKQLGIRSQYVSQIIFHAKKALAPHTMVRDLGANGRRFLNSAPTIEHVSCDEQEVLAEDPLDLLL